MACYSTRADKNVLLRNLGIYKTKLIEILGTPIGSVDKVAQWLQTLAEEYRQTANDHQALIFSHPHESLELFFKTVIPKLTYISQMLPLSLSMYSDFVGNATTTNTNNILNLLQVPFLHPVEKLNESQLAVGLPKSHSGGGFSFLKNISHAAFLGSWISVYHSSLEFKPNLIPLFEDFWQQELLDKQAVYQAYDNFSDFIAKEWKIQRNTSVHQLLTLLTEPPANSPSSPSNYRPQKKFTSHQLKVIKKEIMNPTEDDSLCQVISENKVGPTTHLWMVAYPWSDTTGFQPHKTLSAKEFRSAY